MGAEGDAVSFTVQQQHSVLSTHVTACGVTHPGGAGRSSLAFHALRQFASPTGVCPGDFASRPGRSLPHT